MADKQYTYPNCESCGAHDKLEEDMNSLCHSNKIEHEKLFHKLNEIKKTDSTNQSEHISIIHKMELLSNDLSWNNKIGYFMIAGMIAILGTLYKIHFDNRLDAVHHIKSDTSIIAIKKDVNNLVGHIAEGERLHYRNERIIEQIAAKLDVKDEE